MKLLIYMPSFGDGGVERMLVNTATGLSDLGVGVDFWTGSPQGPFLQRLPPAVRLMRIPMGSAPTAVWSLARYALRERPDVVLTAKDRALRWALWARRLARRPFRIVARPGTTVSQRLAERSALKRRLVYRSLARSYRRADLVVANSHGVAHDVATITGILETAIPVVRNPVITPDLDSLAQAPVEHPWFRPGAVPVILGAGGLRAQKDFPTLIRAFARVRVQRRCRLVIVGRGRLLGRLQALARELGVQEHTAFPGFIENPYPLLRRASVFVLASRWEGSPNILTEALALGTPAVSTDCPSGPREILEGGRYGPLVPLGDVAAMAAAILQVLDSPLPAELLRQAVAEYTVEENARRYKALLDGLVAG